MATVAPPRPPEQDELQALIEEARQRARRRRRRYAVTLLLAVLAGVGAYALVALSAGVPTRTVHAAPAVSVAPQAFRPGQFWYTRTISSDHQWLPAGGMTIDRRGFTHWHGPHVLFHLRVSEETWVGVDGTIRDRVIIAGVRFAYPRQRAIWAAYGRPVPNFNHAWLGWMSHDGITVGGDRFPPGHSVSWGEWIGPSGWDVGDGLFSYRQLASLPTRPAALRARLRSGETALSRREVRKGDAQSLASATAPYTELSDIGGLLASPVPAAVRLALIHAALTLPGVTVSRHAHDSLGRPGVAVSASAGLAFQRLIFSPASGALLEAAPDVSVVAQGVVGSAYALPKGVRPIRAAGAPPRPQTPAISPVVGNPKTVFKLKLPFQPSRRAPALDWMLIGTPALRCFAGFVPRLPPLVASGGTYKLSAPIGVHHRRWCPGKYELTVQPDHSPRPDASQLPPSTSPDFGSSIYFRVT